GSCDPTAIGALATSARDAAASHGVILGNYDLVLTYFPSRSYCAWVGIAGGFSPDKPGGGALFNGRMNGKLVAHELLHNFGALHADSYSCGSATIASPASCTITDRGNPFPMMGGGSQHFDAVNKAAQGWFGGCNVVTATRNGIFDIVPI